MDIDIKLSPLISSLPIGQDTYSIIYNVTTLPGNAKMRTFPIPDFTCNQLPFITEADIEILQSTNFTWHYTTGDDVSATELDFNHLLLHEIGHALGLEHSIDLVYLDKT